MKTLREKFIAALIKRGEKEVKRTSKYIVFTRQAGGHFYIGKSGSLRFGSNIASSIPVGQSFKDILLKLAEDS